MFGRGLVVDSRYKDNDGSMGQGMANPGLGLCVAVSILVAAVLPGCAQMPLAQNPPLRWQPSMRAVTHWRLLAKDSGQNIYSWVSKENHPRIFVRESAVRSPFGQAFETYLSDYLSRSCQKDCDVTQGHRFPGAPGPGRVIYVDYGVQCVHHPAGSERPPFGLFTLLGVGVWLGHQAANHWTVKEDFPAAIAEGAALDLLANVVAAPTHTELIVSIAVSDGAGTILARDHRSYYVDDSDAGQYADTPLYVSVGNPVTLEVRDIHLVK